MAESVNNQTSVLTGIQNLGASQAKTQVRNFEGADFLTFFETEVLPAPTPDRNKNIPKVDERPKKLAITRKDDNRQDSRSADRKETNYREDRKADNLEKSEKPRTEAANEIKDDTKVEAPDKNTDSQDQQKAENINDETVKVEETAEAPQATEEESVVSLENASDAEIQSIEQVTESGIQTIENALIKELTGDIEAEDSEIESEVSLESLIQIENLQASPQLRERINELLENIEEGIEQGIFDLNDGVGDEDFKIDLGQFVGLLKELVSNPDANLQPVVEHSKFQEQLVKIDELIDQSIEVFEGSFDKDLTEEEQLTDLSENIEIGEKLDLKKKSGFKNINELEHSEDIEKVEVKTDKTTDNNLDKKINKMLAVARQGMNLRDKATDVSKQNQTHSLIVDNSVESLDQSSESSSSSSKQNKQHSQHRTSEFISTFMQQGDSNKASLAQRFMDVLEPVQKATNKDNSILSAQETNTRKSQAGQMVRKPAFARSQSVILNQIIESSKALKPPIMNSIKIILKPDHLGELRLTVKQVDDQMRVRMEAENHTVKEVLDKNSQAIRDALRQQGIDVDRIEVELRHQKEQQEQQADQESKDSESKKNKNNKEFSLEDELIESTSQDDIPEREGSQVNQLA